MKESSVSQPPHSGRFEAVRIFAAKNAEEIVGREPKLAFLVPEWFAQLRIFQDGESEKMIEGAPSESERQEHKTILAMLISHGEFLVNRLRRQAPAKPIAGVTLADVEATLEGLYDKQRVFYGGMTEARRAQILGEVFGAS